MLFSLDQENALILFSNVLKALDNTVLQAKEINFVKEVKLPLLSNGIITMYSVESKQTKKKLCWN